LDDDLYVEGPLFTDEYVLLLTVQLQRNIENLRAELLKEEDSEESADGD